MKLEDLLGNISIERGFYIHNKGYETFYTCADDFYEDPATPYLYERPVEFIDVLNARLRIILGD